MRCPWPRRQKPAHPQIPADTGGTQARVRAEAALVGAMYRREEVRNLRSLWAGELAANHIARDILTTFRGERA